MKHLMHSLPQYFYNSCMDFFVQVLQNFAYSFSTLRVLKGSKRRMKPRISQSSSLLE